MKKFLTVLIMITILASIMTTGVFAASNINANEQRVLDSFQVKIVVDGKEVMVPDSYINQAKVYLMSDGVDMTKEQADKILEYVSQAIAIAKTADTATKQNAFENELNAKILRLGEKAAAVMGLRTVTTGRRIVRMYDASNKLVFEATPTVKFTGASLTATIAVIAALAILLLAAVVLGKKYLPVK